MIRKNNNINSNFIRDVMKKHIFQIIISMTIRDLIIYLTFL